jgi:hypothetical protein
MAFMYMWIDSGLVLRQVRIGASVAATRVQMTLVVSLPMWGKRAPIRLSASVPRNAAMAMRSAVDGASIRPRARARMAVREAAMMPARVPGREMAPSVPGGTFSRVVIRRGARLRSCPISDSEVSAKAAPREATKAVVKRSEPVALARMAEDGDGAVGQGVAGATASSVFLGGAGALLALVAEPGQEGTTDHEEGEDREARWAEAGVDDGSNEEPAEGTAAADHSERVSQCGESRGYEEGYQELCCQRTFERRWKRWRA